MKRIKRTTSEMFKPIIIMSIGLVIIIIYIVGPKIPSFLGLGIVGWLIVGLGIKSIIDDMKM